MPLIIPSNTISAAGYEIDNSLRFDDGSSDYLEKTFSTSSDDIDVWTFSVWFKRGFIGTAWHPFFEADDGANSDTIGIYNDQLYLGDRSGTASVTIPNLFRDPSAWYHLYIRWNGSLSGLSNVLKIYINGIEATSFSALVNRLLLDTDTFNFGANVQKRIGNRSAGSAQYFDGYMSEFVFIDGTAYDPTSFGEFDEDSGIWKPIDVSGLTFGTNGFYLDFENSGSLGADVSGNSNNFTVNNLTSIDQTTDTPTNNFATLNPLSTVHTENISSMLSNGNVDYSPSGDYSIVKSNIPFGTTGKWYVEAKINTTPGGSGGLGVQRLPATSYSTNSYLSYQCNDYCYSYQGGGKIAKGSASSTTVASGLEVFTAGDIIAMLFDADNNEIKWYNNDTLIYTLDLSTAPDGYYINDGEWVFAYMGYSGNGTININFGNPTITISSGNSDANGYGNFEYSTKDGYALNTKNLAEYG